MKARITFDLGDRELQALAARYGRKGRATRAEVETVIAAAVDTLFSDFVSEMEQHAEKETPR